MIFPARGCWSENKTNNGGNSYYYGLDSLTTWLHHIGGPFDVYERIGFYISCGQFQIADSIFKNIDSTKLSKYEKPSYRSLAKMWGTLSDAITGGRSFYNLNLSDISKLDTFTSFEIAYNRNRQMLWNLSTYLRDVAIDKSSYTTATASSSTTNPYLVGPTFFCILSLSSSSSSKGEGVNGETQKHIVGRRNVDFGRVHAYPNPSDGYVTFEYTVPKFMAGSAATIVVTNIIGEKVWQQQLPTNMSKMVWNTDKLASGMYIYQVSTSKGIVGTGKVVLSK